LDIQAIEVKKLRDKTGAGIMDCKKALMEALGDFVKAERLLKELGLATVKKKAGRTTKEGRVFSSIGPERGVLAEVSCETDFVAKNKEFKAMGEEICRLALDRGQGAKKEDFDPLLQEAIGKIKENIELRRFAFLTAGANDLLVDYIHGEGNIGVMVKFSLSHPALKGNPRVKEVCFDLALHTAAFSPAFLSKDKVGASYLKEQEEIFMKQAQRLGKPENILKGIVQGKLNKHLAEVCLLEQAFVKDQDLKVSKLLGNLGREVGGKIEINDYLYYKVGEELN